MVIGADVGIHGREGLSIVSKDKRMEPLVHQLAETVALVVNIIAILAIAVGSIQGAIGLGGLLLARASEDQLRPVWLRFGRWLVAGLSFQLASDIVETAIAPGWEDVGMLAAIAVVRTFLNYFLERDMDSLRERDLDERSEAVRT